MPKRKSEEAIDQQHEMPVPISSTEHMWLRGNKQSVTLEYVAHAVDDLGRPSEVTASVIVMSPQQFGKVAECFMNMVERLASVETH